MIQQLVLISGKVCSGKSTQAKAIVRNDPRFGRAGLADKLKCDVEIMAQKLITPDNKSLFRPVLQEYGTMMRQLYGENYWCRRLMEYLDIPRTIHGIVIDDIRYPNELRYFQLYGWLAGIPVLAVRLLIHPSIQERRYRTEYGVALEPSKRDHISETALDTSTDFDMLIDTAMSRWYVTQLIADSMKMRGFDYRYSVEVDAA